MGGGGAIYYVSRRIQVVLGRPGHPISEDRAWRLWKLAGLQVPCKRPPRRPRR